MKTHLLLSIFLCISSLLSAQLVNLDWAKQIKSSSTVECEQVFVSDSGYVYSIGFFKGAIDIDPGPDSLILQAAFDLNINTTDLFIQKLDSLGNLVWAKQVSFIEKDLGKFISVDRLGNVYIAGSFSVDVDFDPGPDSTVIQVPPLKEYAFLLKLDPSGNFVWVKHLPTTGLYARSRGLIVSDSSDIYLIGVSSGTVNFDVGGSNYSLYSLSSPFVAKYNSTGGLLWVRQLIGPGSKSIQSIEIESDNFLYIAGTIRDTTYFNHPFVSDTIVAPTGLIYNMFVQKLDQNGNSIWLRYFEGTNRTLPFKMAFDSTHHILIAGEFNGSTDFDPSSAVDSLSEPTGSISERDIFILKLDSAGQYMWAKQIGGEGVTSLGSINVDGSGNVFTTGGFTMDVDFDPGLGSAILSDPPGLSSSGSMFLQKLDSAGNLVWVNLLVEEIHTFTTSATMDASSQLFVEFKFSDSVDVDPGPDSILFVSNSFSDAGILTFTQGDCGDFTIIIDSVTNVSCTNDGYASVLPLNEQGPYTYVWDVVPPITDSTIEPTASGLYTVTVSSISGCQNERSVLMDGPGFGGIDLGVNLVATPFRPVLSSRIWLDVFNEQCPPSSGQLLLVLDSLLMYHSATPPPDMIVGDSLMWNVPILTYDSAHFQPEIIVWTNDSAMIGQEVCLDLLVSPLAGDVDTSNNIRQYCFPIVNSYDPNDKQVFPIGTCDVGYVEESQLLTYTIRFQNTGNADAIDIFILDTLEADLHLNSVKVISQSHSPMITEVLPGNVLKFRFDEIYLPDSTSNEPESHGYVIFEVYPDTGLSNGTLIENQVGIYFDFNDPILTNTVSNTVIDHIPLFEQSMTEIACNSFELNGQTYTSSGVYMQQFTTDEGCDSSLTLNLSIESLVADIIQEDSGLVASIPNAMYQWLDCDAGYMIISDQTNQSFTPTQSGTYAVIIDNGICVDTSECLFVSSVMIEASIASALHYYPNPSSGMFSIELGKTYEKIQIRIYNVLGHEISQKKWNHSDQVQFFLPDVSGLYFIKIFVDGRETTLKVMRE
ncbi:MAG: T9SS type A sorting domain-containing protein [Bacteroidota bacterium]